MIKARHEGEIRTITGNAAAAYGAMLCRPDVVALYPITPQTEVVEQLSQFSSSGLLDAERKVNRRLQIPMIVTIRNAVKQKKKNSTDPP